MKIQSCGPLNHKPFQNHFSSQTNLSPIQDDKWTNLLYIFNEGVTDNLLNVSIIMADLKLRQLVYQTMYRHTLPAFTKLSQQLQCYCSKYPLQCIIIYMSTLLGSCYMYLESLSNPWYNKLRLSCLSLHIMYMIFMVKISMQIQQCIYIYIIHLYILYYNTIYGEILQCEFDEQKAIHQFLPINQLVLLKSFLLDTNTKCPSYSLNTTEILDISYSKQKSKLQLLDFCEAHLIKGSTHIQFDMAKDCYIHKQKAKSCKASQFKLLPIV